VSITATINETERAIATVFGSAEINSPTEPERMRSGKNENMIVRVAVSTGTNTSPAERHATSSFGTFLSRSST